MIQIANVSRDAAPELELFDGVHVESKAWEVCREKRARSARVLFWNVTSRPEDVLERGIEGRESI